MRCYKPLALLLAAALALSACGIKPKHLTPPSGAEGPAKTFPRTYPNPEL